MRICYVTDSLPGAGQFGGIGVYTQTAADALAARGHEVHVLVYGQHPVADCERGRLRVHTRPVRWLPVVGALLPGLGQSLCLAYWLWQLHRRHRFDLVEGPNWGGIGLVAAVLRFVPFIVRLYTSTTEALEARRAKPSLPERFEAWTEAASARAARAVVTHSAAHARKLERGYRLHDVTVIPLGVSFSHLPAEPRRLGVLTVGAMNARKGTVFLLEAIPAVLRAVPDAEFWLVGNDPGGAHEKAFRAAHPDLPASRVQFLGFRPDQTVRSLYRDCALYVSPSAYESFGLTLVEAMTYGKPVVAFGVGAIPEVLDDGVTGILAPPFDVAAFTNGIVTMLRDERLRRRCGDAGRARALEYFSAPRMAEKLERFYETVAAAS